MRRFRGALDLEQVRRVEIIVLGLREQAVKSLSLLLGKRRATRAIWHLLAEISRAGVRGRPMALEAPAPVAGESPHHP